MMVEVGGAEGVTISTTDTAPTGIPMAIIAPTGIPMTIPIDATTARGGVAAATSLERNA